ncbi:MAG: Inositol 2-dehydrogenase/D-chiro-inositol 3-dehydrogenase [Candidatus Moanabacter tarae]|uniref:Inositol 2-dehydrogenase/D-chiro-inositol 3-dehydrogenase n=1 Tax=Candidatus Moanibacter tarae TaxID=2200854 RepID=A0A2Z4AD20_9BACT|nr:MAG: Inositol 2-dehydrogenase/D-chiro-inositol 3-dehydrogenase [Candidatus Moanabacter tarae]
MLICPRGWNIGSLLWLTCSYGYINNMDRIRIGLIGYGGWTHTAYVPALQCDGRAQIVSAAAPSVTTQQCITEELGPEVIVFNSNQAGLEGPPLDAIMIAVLDSAHGETLITALKSGAAIFYEPPLAGNVRMYLCLPRLYNKRTTHCNRRADCRPTPPRRTSCRNVEGLRTMGSDRPTFQVI